MTNLKDSIKKCKPCKASSSNINYYTDFNNFPSVGESNTLYVDTSTGATYIWNDISYITASQVAYLTEEITYSEITTKIANSELVSGQKYLLTDYQTVHYFMNGDAALTDINTGPIEPLVITALTSNSISNEVNSLNYPQDIVYYDWNPANWTSNVNFSTASVIIPNFKGVITYRKDVTKNIECFYDFREVKYRRWEILNPAYDPTVNYLKDQVVDYNNVVYVSLRDNIIGIVPTDDVYWSPIIDKTETVYWSCDMNTLQYHGNILVNNTNFIDVNTFNGNYNFAFNIYIGKRSGPRFLPNIVFIQSNETTRFYSNYFQGGDNNFGNCTIGRGSQANNWFGHFGKSIIGRTCQGNVFSDYFFGSVVGNLFRYNKTRNGFNYNLVGNKFDANDTAQFISLRIGNGFYRNSFNSSQTAGCFFSKNFAYNVFGSEFISGLITDQGFTANQIFAPLSNINFIGATHVYGAYTKNIYTRQDGQYRLKYIDNTDIEIIVPVTN